MNTRMLLCSPCLAALCVPTHAGETKDQVTATTNFGTGLIDAQVQHAQTFTVGKAGRFARVEIHVRTFSATADLFMELRTVDAAGIPTHTTLARVGVYREFVSTTFAVVSADFTPFEIDVVPGEKLAIALVSSVLNPEGYQVSFDAFDPYPGGSLYNAVASFAPPGGTLGSFFLPGGTQQYDWLMTTYVHDRVLDAQFQPLGGLPTLTVTAGANGTRIPGQTFVVGASGAVSKVDLLVYRLPPATAPLDIQLRSLDANGAPAALLASTQLQVEQIPLFFVGYADTYTTVDFDPPVPVLPGERYAITMQSSDPGLFEFGWRGVVAGVLNPADPFTGGAAYLNSDEIENGDMAFRVFLDPFTVSDSDGDGIDDAFEAGFGGDIMFVDSSGNPAMVTGSNTSPGGSTISAGAFAVTLPQNTTTPGGEIDIKFKSPPDFSNFEVEIEGALLPSGETKTIQMPFGTANAICIADETSATLIPGETCTGDFRTEVPIPQLGDPPLVVPGSAEDPLSPGDSIPTSYTVTRISATEVQIEGMVHSLVVAITDSDLDGLTDDDELFIVFTDPNNDDTDGDGLLDGVEVDTAMGSGCPDPLNPDTDGDLLLDGDEVASVPSTNPCAFDTDGDGLSDTIDPEPTIPSTSSGSLEDATRLLADLIDGFDVGLFSGPNDNARKGRQNSMSSRIRNAANAIAQDEANGAVATLTTILEQIDGSSPPADWMEGSPEKTALAEAIAALIVTLM